MDYDTIVIGAGSAGMIVATRLAQRGEQVLLLEAGPDLGDDVPAILGADLKVPVTEFDWGWRSEGDREIDVPRGKVVGGSSATNAVAAIRPQPADLDALGIAEWSWDACLPALNRFEADREFGHMDHHGADGPIAVERIDLDACAPVTRAVFDALAERYGTALDQNAPGAHGAGAQMSNTRDGFRQSTAVTYLPLARTLPGFTLRAGVLVDRLIIDGGRCVGARLAEGEEVRAARVVLSAGAIASPMVLMRSGIGPAEHLTELGIPCLVDLPVGENFHDHPAIGLMATASDPSGIDQRLHARAMARVSFEGRAGEEDVHIFGSFTGYGTRSPIPPEGFVVAGFTTRPESRGWIRLRSSDPTDVPRIHFNFLATDADVEMFSRLLLEIEQVLDQPSLKGVIESLPWRPSGVDPQELRRVARAAALTDHHEAGTVPIGSCLDARLAVHGVEALYVVDASVIPEPPRANTNFPTMMVAERFVELLDG